MRVDAVLVVAVAALGVLVGVLATLYWWQAVGCAGRGRAHRHLGGGEFLPIGQLLGVLPGASILVEGASGIVARASARAVSLGLIVSDRLSSVEMRSMVGEVHRDGITREYDVDIRRPSLAKGTLELRVRAAPLGDGTVLLLVEDLSGARRVDTVRRDFVANVSHELKTPIGALSLLAEAVSEAADEPVEVLRFADRMRMECSRLTNLVADLIDLSRLQGTSRSTAPGRSAWTSWWRRRSTRWA